MRLRDMGPGQLKQDDRAPILSPGSACLPRGWSSASMGQGAGQGQGQSAELGAMPSVPDAFPPSQPREGYRTRMGQGLSP